MGKIQKKYKKILQVISVFQLSDFLRKKVLVFGIVALPLTSAGAGMTIYIDNMANVAENPVFAQETVINLDEHIIVKFAAPIRDIDEYEKVITTYPQTDMVFEWNEMHTVVEIIPKAIWLPNTQYSIALPHNSQQADEQLSTIFSFETVAYPEVIKTNITEKNNQYINEGEEILITFDKNIDDFDVHAVTRPVLETQQTYDKDTRTLHVKIMEQTQNYKGFHSLTLFAKHKKQAESQFYPVNSVTFNSLLPKPDIWPDQFDYRLTIAALSTAPRI
jgi:hypothetical protein